VKAMVYKAYGSPDEIGFEDIEVPTVKPSEVLVNVSASAVNPGDWFLLSGTPYVMRIGTGLTKPRHRVLGLSAAGTVTAVGEAVEQFRVGEAVLGETNRGAFAELVTVSADACAAKPPSVTFEQAAASGIVGTTALQALRDVAKLQPEDALLINGASGGVGTFAVQIAKSYGAVVTGVCGPSNVELVLSLGADHVIDYTQEDFTASGPYDIILDNVGNRSIRDCRRALNPQGTLILNANTAGGWLGSYIRRALIALTITPFVSQRLRPFSQSPSSKDLAILCEMIDAGKIHPVIDRSFDFADMAEALSYYGRGHARGKVVVDVNMSGNSERGSQDG